MHIPQWGFRGGLVVVALCVWFWTQALIGKRAFPEGRIGDAVLDFTAPLNRYLLDHPTWANRLLIVTSGLIDLLGIFIVGLAIFGPSLRPFLGLIILFSLRQLCQGLCALPPPEGMIWRHPGFPSLLVTYGTASDLFFSGHTAIAVYRVSRVGTCRWPYRCCSGRHDRGDRSLHGPDSQGTLHHGCLHRRSRRPVGLDRGVLSCSQAGFLDCSSFILESVAFKAR